MWFYFSNIKNWIFHKFGCKRNVQLEQINIMERLSHEMRTWLTGIVGYSEYVESSSSEPMVNFTAKIIWESSLCLTRTSNSFFELHRLKLGHLKPDPSSFSCSELVRDVVRTHQRKALDQTVNLEFTCTAETFSVYMYADVIMVRQITDALIFGAVQSSKQGDSIHVDISLDVNQIYMVLKLTISELTFDTSKNKLFAEFWGNDNYKFHLQEGPGVELALTTELIHLLQGNVEHQVRPSKNQILVVRLPMRFKN